MKRVILLLALVMSSGAFAAEPDLILFNGKVFTADAANPQAEALAISGERIVDVGTTKKILALAGPKTKRIDLDGRVVVPGFNDAHFHDMPKPAGVKVKRPSPPGAVPEPTWEEVLAASPDAVKQARKGQWIYASIGQTIVNDPRATRDPIDTIARENPVLLSSWFGHGHLFNTAAMRRVGMGEEEPDPMGALRTIRWHPARHRHGLRIRRRTLLSESGRELQSRHPLARHRHARTRPEGGP